MNTSQNNSAQNPEQTQTLQNRAVPEFSPATRNTLAVSFSHRLSPHLTADDISQLYDSLNPALQRAAAIADLLEIAIDVDGGDAFNAGTIRNAAQAIRLEVIDAKAMLNAFFDSPATVAADKQADVQRDEA